MTELPEEVVGISGEFVTCGLEVYERLFVLFSVIACDVDVVKDPLAMRGTVVIAFNEEDNEFAMEVFFKPGRTDVAVESVNRVDVFLGTGLVVVLLVRYATDDVNSTEGRTEKIK